MGFVDLQDRETGEMVFRDPVGRRLELQTAAYFVSLVCPQKVFNCLQNVFH